MMLDFLFPPLHFCLDVKATAILCTFSPFYFPKFSKVDNLAALHGLRQFATLPSSSIGRFLCPCITANTHLPRLLP